MLKHRQPCKAAQWGGCQHPKKQIVHLIPPIRAERLTAELDGCWLSNRALRNLSAGLSAHFLRENRNVWVLPKLVSTYASLDRVFRFKHPSQLCSNAKKQISHRRGPGAPLEAACISIQAGDERLTDMLWDIAGTEVHPQDFPKTQSGPQVGTKMLYIINWTARQFVSIWFIEPHCHMESLCSRAQMASFLYWKNQSYPMARQESETDKVSPSELFNLFVSIAFIIKRSPFKCIWSISNFNSFILFSIWGLCSVWRRKNIKIFCTAFSCQCFNKRCKTNEGQSFRMRSGCLGGTMRPQRRGAMRQPDSKLGV